MHRGAPRRGNDASNTSRFRVKVIPKASRDRVAGWMGDTVKVSVTAAPERGKANAAVVRLLAEVLGLPRGRVRLIAGETNARKLVEVNGLADDELHARLLAASDQGEDGLGPDTAKR